MPGSHGHMKEGVYGLTKHLTKGAPVSHRRSTTRGSPDSARGLPAFPKGTLDSGLTSAVFILFSWNYDLFWTSLQTYVAAGWGPRLIIIDNSKNCRVLNDAKVSLRTSIFKA